MLSIREALADPQLFGTFFDGESWNRWRVFLGGLFGLRLAPAEIDIWKAHTGREDAPRRPFRGHLSLTFLTTAVGLFVLDRGNVADRLQEAMVLEVHSHMNGRARQRRPVRLIGGKSTRRPFGSGTRDLESARSESDARGSPVL